MLFGCALDAWRLAGWNHAEASWRTDPRMRRVGAGQATLRVLDSGGSGPAVLFAADAPVVLEHYLPLFDKLPAGRRAVAIEFPGLGFSTPGRDYRFTLAEHVEVLRAALDSLEISTATLAFTCVNALVALAFAGSHPQRVEALILSQIPAVAEFARWAQRIDMRVLGRGVLFTPVMGQALMWAAPGFVADKWFHIAAGPLADVPGLVRTSRAAYTRGGAFCLAALNQALVGLRQDQFAPITAPLKILWGDADRTHKKTDRNSAAVWSSSAEIIHWSDTGHCPDLEQPERWLQLLG